MDWTHRRTCRWLPVCLVAPGNCDEFGTLLESALAIDPDEDESIRLLNIVSQRRARLLLDHIDEFFDPPVEP